MGLSGPLAKAATLRTSVVEERRALLQRVLWSRAVEKSGRIREFLTYFCERSLAEPGVEIHEQEIGAQVFGRPTGYDTTQDNIVRVTASQARKKIESYFAQEGSTEPVVLEIPKGQSHLYSASDTRQLRKLRARSLMYRMRPGSRHDAIGYGPLPQWPVPFC